MFLSTTVNKNGRHNVRNRVVSFKSDVSSFSLGSDEAENVFGSKTRFLTGRKVIVLGCYLLAGRRKSNNGFSFSSCYCSVYTPSCLLNYSVLKPRKLLCGYNFE